MGKESFILLTDERLCRDSTSFNYVDNPKQWKGDKPDDWRKTVLRKAKEGIPNMDNNELNNQTVNNQQQEYQPESAIVSIPRR